MNFEDFTAAMAAAVSPLLPDGTSASLICIPRNNGAARYALYVTEPDRKESPLLYLEPFYEAYCTGIPLSDLALRLTQDYKNSVPFEQSFPDFPRKAELLKERIFVKLIHYGKNAKWLKSIPHRQVLDLAVIYELIVPHIQEGYGFSVITRSMMESLRLTESMLHHIAWQNTVKSYPPLICPMQDVLSVPFSLPMYILTNRMKIDGASCMFYPDLLRKLAEFLESDLCIFPSSVHEVIVIPWTNETDKNDMDRIVQEINTSAVRAEEQLSDHAYLYHRQTGEITM